MRRTRIAFDIPLGICGFSTRPVEALGAFLRRTRMTSLNLPNFLSTVEGFQSGRLLFKLFGLLFAAANRLRRRRAVGRKPLREIFRHDDLSFAASLGNVSGNDHHSTIKVDRLPSQTFV